MEEEKQQRLKPRLERRNAMKNINYKVDYMHFHNNQTSFRVKGVDGEFDHIFRTLGLSGPEDFAIPTAAWEQAQKTRSAASSPHAYHDHGVMLQRDINDNNNNNNLISSDHESNVVLGQNIRDVVGIKGVRPPVLAPPPAMLRSLVIVDEVTPTWDLMRSLAPQHDHDHDDDGDSDVICESGMDQKVSSDMDMVVSDESFHSVSPNGSFRRTFSSWQKGEILGKGSFGTVYEGFTDAGIFFAVKEVSLLDDGSQGKQSIFQLQQEISLLSQFEHENIVQYLGTDKENDKLYVFLELVTKGSLARLYQNYCLRDSQVSVYTRQILSGLKYLHDRNVVHRDIKCANILVHANGSVKLADFGLAKATKLNDVKSSKGSPYWMAPEVVNLRNNGYGLAADIWSLGCTVLEMLTRQPPYSNMTAVQALFQIGKGKPPSVPKSLSEDARDFIHRCLQVKPNKRPTAAQLLDHPFVKT